MRAAVMRNKSLVIDEVDEPEPGPGQVLVETIACGICGSDLHFLQHAEGLGALAGEIGQASRFDPARDLVMGHEFSARVVELGVGVDNVAPGDVVVSMPVAGTLENISVIGYSHDYPGGYAERMVLMAPLCLSVPEGLDPKHAALTEPMAVGLHAVNRSGIAQDDSALVLGCGPVGLAVIASLSLAGIGPIVASDFSPARRGLAQHFGADEVVDPRQEPAIEAWRRTASSENVVIYEAVGVPGMIDQAMRDAPRWGRIMVVGACMEQDSFLPMTGIRSELTIQFALGYTPEEFSETLQSIAEGKIDVARLITGEVGIDGVPGAFEALANPEAHAKILVEPHLG